MASGTGGLQAFFGVGPGLAGVGRGAECWLIFPLAPFLSFLGLNADQAFDWNSQVLVQIREKGPEGISV